MARKQKTASNLLEVQNAAKTLFANIRFQSIDNDLRTIMFTSSVPDEGKTTTAWYFAQAAATAGNSVLLIEGDMRRRSIANMLQLHPANGIVSVLTGNVQLKDAIVPTSVRGLYFLDAEPSVPNPADLLASKRMAQLNERISAQFDYVIYDTPPVGTFVDGAVLGRIVDACILVVRPGRAKRNELLLAYEQLSNAEVNVVGLCTTFVEGTGSEYYYSYYTKDHSKKAGDIAVDNAPQPTLPSQLNQPIGGNRGASDNTRTPSSNANAATSASKGRSVPRAPKR